MTTLIAGRVRTKYRNQRTMMCGQWFDSKKEAERYLELRSMLERGEISDLSTQVRYSLTVNHHHVCDYIADFVYTENGTEIVEDAKGFRTKEYRIKRKLMYAVYGILIKEV